MHFRPVNCCRIEHDLLPLAVQARCVRMKHNLSQIITILNKIKTLWLAVLIILTFCLDIHAHMDYLFNTTTKAVLIYCYIAPKKMKKKKSNLQSEKGKQKRLGRATSRSRSQPPTPGRREKVTQINVCIANNKCTISTKTSPFFPKQGDQNAKRTEETHRQRAGQDQTLIETKHLANKWTDRFQSSLLKHSSSLLPVKWFTVLIYCLSAAYLFFHFR